MTLEKISKPNYTLDNARLTRIAEVEPNRYAAHVKFPRDEAFISEAKECIRSYLYLHDMRHEILEAKFSNPYTICVIFTTSKTI